MKPPHALLSLFVYACCLGWARLRAGTAAGITLRPEYRVAKLLVAEVDTEWVVKEHGDSNDELRRWLARTVAPS
jgi:hypothetical protein